MFPNGDNFVFYVGEDCGAGNTNLRGYDAASNSFRWCVDGEDGHTLAWAVEGWNGESWFEDVRVPPGNGDMQVTLSQPWDEVRLLCYNTDSPRPTYHGSLARGHVGKAYRPFSGDRDSLMARAWFRLENPASAGPRGQHNFRDRQTTALFTKSSFIDEHAPLVQYLTNWGNTDVIIIDVERWQRGEARRQGIKATIDSLWRARGINSVVFDAGLTNDWEVWTQPWPAQTGWDVIQENYWETHPPEGNPEWDDIPMAAYILDDAEREFNTAFWTPYVPSMDLYGDVDGDSIPDLDIGFIPVKSEADLAGIIYKNMTYMDMDGLWDSHFESAVFVGDEDYDNPGDGANALRNAELLASLFPSSSYQRWLKQSDGNSYWRTDQFINIHQDGQTFSLFTGPNASRNNLASITWSDIFQWSDVGDCWPGVTLGVTCGLGNVGMTRRYDQPYVLFEDALAQPWGGQIMGVVSFCGTLDDDLVYFFECLLSRLMAEREVALGTHVRMAKRDCAAMGRYSKTVKSIVLMGFPWIRMNNVAHACAVDEPDELTLDFSPPSRIARTLSFTTTSPGLVGVRLVDIAGRTLYHNTASMLPGQHEVNLPHLASGAYFFSLESGGRRWTQRAILMR